METPAGAYRRNGNGSHVTVGSAGRFGCLVCSWMEYRMRLLLSRHGFFDQGVHLYATYSIPENRPHIIYSTVSI